MWRHEPGGTHLIIGYVERILSLLTKEYLAVAEPNTAKAAQKAFFKNVLRFMEKHYRDMTIQDLVKAFGHDRYYFNWLIKRHTGMTYARLLQDIRLKRAEYLLKTTQFPVEEIAQQVGYENMTFFYRIFTEKFNLKPMEMRKTSSSPKISQ